MQNEPSANPASRVAQYLNARVTIYYNNNSGVSDSGTLTYLDWVWVELTKDNKERLLIPHQAIRIIKLLEAGDAESDAAVLLRAVNVPQIPGKPADPGENETRQIPGE